MRAAYPARVSRIQPGETRLASHDFGGDIPHVRRPWSDFLAQLEDVVRRRGSAALPFPADADFRRALRALILDVSAIEGRVRFRPAGHFALGEDLVGALVALRGEIGRAYEEAARVDDGGADLVVAFAKRAQKNLKILLSRIKIAWPYEETHSKEQR